MRVLLVYPEFPDTFWSFKHALPFVHKRASFPPLGLLTVAAMLPEDWELRLVDMNIESLRQRDIEWADCAFVSAMVVQRDSTREVIKRCKEAGLTVVAGGPIFIGEYEQFPEVDHFVLGEAEVSLPQFLADLADGTPERIYQSDVFPDIARSPLPRWDLISFRYYSSMCIQFSRGCPFDCEFCNITAMFGHRPRVKTSQQIISELDVLYERGWRGGVFFVDDNFIGNRKVLKKDVLPTLIAWRRGKSGMSFQTEVSIDLADDAELTRMMVDAGFDTVFVGIETPDENSLAECNKVQNGGRDLVASVKTLQRAGLEVQGGFIVGFDSDTPSIFQRQIEFIQNSGIVTAMVGLLQAPYGTKLYERMKNEGRLLDEFSGNNTDDSMNFRPKMDPQLLHQGYRSIVKSIYAPRAYYRRVRTFLGEYQKSTAVRSRLTWQEISAFFRSIVDLGVRGRDRLEYWRLFFWALLRKPSLFSRAITFAIYGFHFRRVCEMYLDRSE